MTLDQIRIVSVDGNECDGGHDRVMKRGSFVVCRFFYFQIDIGRKYRSSSSS